MSNNFHIYLKIMIENTTWPVYLPNRFFVGEKTYAIPVAVWHNVWHFLGEKELIIFIYSYDILRKRYGPGIKHFEYSCSNELEKIIE